MKKIVYSICAGAAVYAISQFCLEKTDHFTWERVRPAHVLEECWNVHSLSTIEKSQVKTILDQKFTYFGRGAQSYVFFSEDGRYVLKFFRHNRYSAPFWVRYFMPPWLHYRAKKIRSKQENLIHDFTSYKIAFDTLQNETGLVLVQLNPSQELEQKVTLVDRLNIAHTIELGEYDFILQKKGELVYSTLHSLLQEGQIEEAKRALLSLLKLLRVRCEKGVADRDPNLSKNFAFIGEQAVQIDIGRFSYAPVKRPQIPDDFKGWLHTQSPDLSLYFEEQYQRQLGHL